MAKAQRVLSIEIGYSMTQVCEMDYGSKKPKLYGVFSMKTPEGILNDGYINPSEDFIRDLKSYIAANAMVAKRVIFVVSSTKVANREATVPAVKPNKVRDLLMTSITDYFPVDPSMYQFAHTIMDTVTDENKNKQYRVMVMAVPSDILDGYNILAQGLGLEIVSIDYSGNAIFQALRERVATGVNLTVKIDERSSLLTVTNNGIITMQRSGIYGADQVVDIMMETDIYGEPLTYETAIKTLRRNNMVMKQNEMDDFAAKEQETEELDRKYKEVLTMAEITGDRTEVAAAEMAARQADTNMQMLKLRRDVTGAYEQLINSIIRVIDYYNSKNREAAIDNIIITGIAADFWGFAELLSEELGRNVEVLRNLAGTSIEQSMHLRDVSLGDYISVIGACLSDTGFLPQSGATDAKGGRAKSSTAQRRDMLCYVIMGVSCAAVIVLLALYVPKYMGAKSQNEYLKEKKAQLEPVQDTYNQYISTQNDYNYITAVHAASENYNTKIYNMFMMLEKVLPKDVEIQNMSITTDNIMFTVRVSSNREAAAAIMALREYEDFSNVEVTATTKVKEGDADAGVATKEYVQFAANCTYGFNSLYAVDEETQSDAPVDGAAAE